MYPQCFFAYLYSSVFWEWGVSLYSLLIFPPPISASKTPNYCNPFYSMWAESQFINLLPFFSWESATFRHHLITLCIPVSTAFLLTMRRFGMREVQLSCNNLAKFNTVWIFVPHKSKLSASIYDSIIWRTKNIPWFIYFHNFVLPYCCTALDQNTGVNTWQQPKKWQFIPTGISHWTLARHHVVV